MGEPTTIDNLQIEIQSNSTNAASGIDALATSLGNLKKQTISKTAISNLESFSNVIKNFGNVHGASNALRTLANSIEKLKSVGTVSSLTKSLTALPTALKALENVNLESVASKADRVAVAVAPLSSIKTSGLGSMVNAMSKLDKVTKDLSDEAIANFAEKVKKLDDVLGPVSQKMTTLSAGFKGLNTVVKQTNVSIDQANAKVHVGIFNFSNLTNVLSSLSGVFHQVVTGFANIVDSATQWDGIAARFGKGFGAQAQETYEWIQRLNEEMGINVQQFMQYSSVYATMLTGFGVANEDASKMALGYAELTYDIWAGYNDIYRTFDEAAEAVRSAIAGEVEPVRRAGFTIIESTLQQTAANHGLEISLENATEAQKSYLRYLTLVDQAHSQDLVGTYAAEMGKAEGLLRTLSQQLKSLAQAFGSLFIPMLVKALPYVQAFVELLTEGVHWLANLFGIEIQDISGTWGDYNSGISDAVENTQGVTGALDDATKAAKALKNASIGIDELNVISKPTDSSGGGSGGSGSGAGGGGFDGLDVDSLWDESIFDTIQSDVDKIKGKLKDVLPIAGGIATALAGWKLTNFLKELDDVDKRLVGLSKGLSVAGIVIAVGSLVWDFTGAYLEGGGEKELLKAIGTTVIGSALAYFLAGKPGASITILASGVVTLSRLAVEIGEGTIEWDDPEALLTGLVGGIETAIGALFTWKTLGPIIKKEWPKLTALGSKLGPWGWVATAVVGGIVLSFIERDFTEDGYKIGEKIGTWISTSIETGITWVKENLEIEDVWDILALMFIPGELEERIGTALEPIFKDIRDAIEEKIENLRGNINEFFGGFFDGLFDGLGLDVSWAKEFADIFDIEYLDIVMAIVEPSTLGDNIMSGIKKGIDKSETLSAIRDKLEKMWENAKTWWDNNKPELGKYTPSIGDIKSKVSSAWSSAKTWWDTKKVNFSTYTPSIGSIAGKLKTAWESAKDWWNKKRSNLSYTPSIGSIASKLSSAWTTAKNWWNKSRSSLSYTPSIGSIKDKIVSAWNTAKSWWKNNVSGLSTKLSISIPKISIKWDTVSALGKEFRYPTGFKLSYAAQGGIFDQGSLVWAGERGPEIVANAAGGKTGVMNVEQMQDAVYEGVFAAITAAMSGNSEGGAQAVNVYLDGRQITAAVEQRQRERGASIMGSGVYSY